MVHEYEHVWGVAPEMCYVVLICSVSTVPRRGDEHHGNHWSGTCRWCAVGPVLQQLCLAVQLLRALVEAMISVTFLPRFSSRNRPPG